LGQVHGHSPLHPLRRRRHAGAGLTGSWLRQRRRHSQGPLGSLTLEEAARVAAAGCPLRDWARATCGLPPATGGPYRGSLGVYSIEAPAGCLS
jgi:hypothetical protein